MTSKRVWPSGILALALFACGSGGAGDLPATFVESCILNLGLEKPMCQCMAQKAKESLTSNGMAFVIASMDNDVPKIQKIAGKMKRGGEGTAAAISFMGRGPKECIEELEGS